MKTTRDMDFERLLDELPKQTREFMIGFNLAWVLFKLYYPADGRYYKTWYKVEGV